MQVIRCDLPEHKAIEVHPLADLHIGDNMSDWRLIQDRLAYIEKTPHAYCTLGGDLMDTAIASSIGDTYGANLQPMEQLKTCVKIFEPIKHKILCVLPGNHENRVYKADGIDLTELMCSQLGIGKRYSSTTALMFVRVGNDRKRNRPVFYSIYETHGSGGGRKEGGKANRLADLASIVDADIYIHSHTHLPLVFKNSYYRADPSNNSVAMVDKLFINTGAVLNYGGYGDKAGFKPASKANPVIYLDGDRKHFTGTL